MAQARAYIEAETWANLEDVGAIVDAVDDALERLERDIEAWLVFVATTPSLGALRRSRAER